MKQLSNFCIDDYGNVIYHDNNLFELLYSDKINLSEIIVFPSDKILKFIKTCKMFDHNQIIKIYDYPNEDIKEFDKKYQEKWFIPEKYLNIDVFKYVTNKCNTEEEIIRIAEEYILFEKYNMINILKFLIYIIDIMRENNIVWGVGRGSSVASYILYKLDVHRVNSLKYELDINEFLR